MKKATKDLVSKYGAELADKVRLEKINYETSSADQREVLKKVYRNYTSQFDNPRTKYTKREKVFVPLTEMAVNHIASKTQVNVDAISILPGKDDAIGQARLLEEAVKAQLNVISFPEFMDDETFYKVLMGMTVTSQGWEYEKDLTYAEISKKALDNSADTDVSVTVTKKKKVKKDNVEVKIIPLLDCYIDPTAESIQSAPSFIVRTVHALSDVKKNKLYTNTDDLQPMGNVQDNYNNTSLNKYITGNNNTSEGVEMVELYHRYGPIELEWVTGNEADSDTIVEGIITCASNGQSFQTIGIRLSPFKHGYRPFEEDWYEKVPHRWYGRGVGEKCVHLNRWMNETVNRRIDNAEVLQNKMFLIRRGANIDQRDLISRASGGIKVDDINNDIKELQHTDISASSYKDEDTINQIAQSLLGMFDIQDANPQTATEAAIDSRNAGTTFGAVKRRTNNYLRRLIKCHIIPLMIQFMDGETQIRLEGHPQEFKDIDQINGVTAETAQEMGNYRFISIKDMSIFDVPYDVVVDIDESGVTNKAVRIAQLKDTIAMVLSTPPNMDGSPRLKVNVDELFEELLSLQGLGGPRFQMDQKVQPQPMQPMQPAGVPTDGSIQAQITPDVPTGFAQG